ncbi:MAG TPA: V-type ATP synthase subunit B [Candidatus Hydrogenedentes bacterium]|nr:V-type ATP synthase subunit B [Candidatus Hydrogenedentota bacterium]HOL76326.1 V-type ATP synthase subunit B [Candidatus Hydrogenedentota bacterium]HPO86154.1 V-type ATP synthase subunit B [Candidatus Hydrogenedentota bacterium]
MTNPSIQSSDLLEREYWDVQYISGPLVFLRTGSRFPTGAILELQTADGVVRHGQVLEVSQHHAVVQVLEGTQGLDVKTTTVSLQKEAARLGVSRGILGRRFNGVGAPIDGMPAPVPDAEVDIMGAAINPVSRDKPSDFIETGISAIDGMNTLVRGQKLPIFAGAGLPANEVAALIVQQAGTKNDTEEFVVVFGAMGLTEREAAFFLKSFDSGGRGNRVVAFINKANDPAIERLFAPRCALTAAEYLAFELGYHVLVILTDMTNYCDALRQISSAREEIPGRRGYPGYMYTDLSTIYERAGRIRGKKGSVTQVPILTMPDDDMTHPIPDLTGYITEGQIVLSRGLHRQGVFPPVDILPCLSRLMNNGIGEGRTRADHRQLANQLYASYAHGRDIRRLMSIVGEEALGELDRKYLAFARAFEQQMIHQGESRRTIEETLDLGWRLLSLIPKEELTRINKDLIDRYYCEIMEDGVRSPFLKEQSL